MLNVQQGAAWVRPLHLRDIADTGRKTARCNAAKYRTQRQQGVALSGISR